MSDYWTMEHRASFSEIRAALRHPNPLIRTYAETALRELSAEQRAEYDGEGLEMYLDRTVRVVA